MHHLQDAFALPLVSRTLTASPLMFIDVGAAVGVEEPWLTMVSNRALTRVVAFEPHPENFAAIARVPNGAYHQMAISDSPGSAAFFLDGTLSSLVDRSEEAGRPLGSLEVRVETLSRLRQSGVIASLDVVKTDTECVDFEALGSAGAYLDDEILAVQCEFSMHGSRDERPFRDYDALLQPKGFRLIGLSHQRGSEGEIAGGNFLYLRSVFDLVAKGGAETRTRGIKLFMVALAISHLDTAYVITRALADAGVIDAHESAALMDYLNRWVYVPDAQPFTLTRVRAATVLGNITAVVGGGFTRGVSTPDANRLENYRRLVRRPSRLAPAETANRLYEGYYREAARSHRRSPTS